MKNLVTNFQKLLVVIGIGLSAMLSAAADQVADTVDEPVNADSADAVAPANDSLLARLRALLPEYPVTGVSPGPIDGFVTVEFVGGQSVYATADARYLFAGEIYSLSEEGLLNVADERRRELLGTIDPAGTIDFPASGERKATIYVFTDITCPYCQLLHKDVPALNELGIEVRYLGWPRAGVDSETYEQMVSVWCAKDRQAAMTLAKSGTEVPAATCDNDIAQHFVLGQQMGVIGTPAIILESGRMLGGYLPPADLAKELGI